VHKSFFLTTGVSKTDDTINTVFVLVVDIFFDPLKLYSGHVIQTESRDNDTTLLMVEWLNLNNNTSKPKFLRLLWDIVNFRLVVHLLNMIRLNLLFCIQNFIYTDFFYKFGTFLYQFFETGTAERTLMGLDQLLKCLGFCLYTLSFFFTVL